MAKGDRMLTRSQAKEILQVLQVLPPDKFAEAYDYILFLRERYGTHTPTDVSDMWTDADMADLVTTSMGYAAKTVWAGEA